MLTKTASSKNKYKNIVKYYYNFKKLYSMLLYFNMHFIPVMEKMNFQRPLLQSSVILLCWVGIKETFLIIINVENSHAA